MTHEEVMKVIERIGLMKDVDPDTSRILNDAHEACIYLLTELATARARYNKALEVIYNNGDK